MSKRVKIKRLEVGRNEGKSTKNTGLDHRQTCDKELSQKYDKFEAIF